MTEPGAGPQPEMTTLVVRKTIRATPERLFEAWTDPAQLRGWWGPEGVNCIDAEVDLRVGGRYRIGNQLPDGKILWIVGEFEAVERPHRLSYTWQIEGSAGASERVTVRFEPYGSATEVVVTHERIPDETVRKQHEYGWRGCLEGLAEYLGG
jgi:uncharacterized protein YndB with AHSA1/START domain